MSVRINLEIGHEASVRTKRTPEGFTHDWEVFVRGYDSTEIHYFIEKVVFHLHETFPKPKRVVKEPPYSVKESGYAGFNLPIEIYLRNKDEPKKIKFNYDLHLQPTGPAIMNVQKEKYIFSAPNDEFKNKLLRGGGNIVNSLTAQENNESQSSRVSLEAKNELTNKPKLSGADLLRKNKTKEEPRVPDSFQSLFGTPITKTSKVFPDLKTISKDVNKNTNTSSSSNNTKIEKEKDKNKEKSKYSPNKERDKERDREKVKDKSDGDKKKEKDDKKSKERNREREHSREKNSKKEKSPKPRSPTPKRSPKRPSSPKRTASPSTTKHKEKEERRLDSNSKEKKEKTSEERSDKKQKRDKRDKDKEHKETKHKEKESQRSSDYKDHKNKEQKPLLKEQLKDKEPSPLPPPPKVEKKEKIKEIPKEELKSIKEPDVAATSVTEKSEKTKSDKNEEKQKHKHKKKDKDRKDRDKEKSHKEKSKEKEKPVIIKPPEPVKEIKEEKNNSLFSSPKNEEKQKKPISLFSEAEADSSNSSVSSKEEPVSEPVEKPEPKKEKESLFEPKKPKVEVDKVKKEKTKKNKEKKVEKEEKKRKRKINKTDDEPLEKVPKEEITVKDSASDSEQNSNTSKALEVDKENQENPEDYMQMLRDLQSKIMNLQDNAELQRVVQLIAATGRYEVSQRTFDFDLCLLEKSTVRQLQEFFTSSS